MSSFDDPSGAMPPPDEDRRHPDAGSDAASDAASGSAAEHDDRVAEGEAAWTAAEAPSELAAEHPAPAAVREPHEQLDRRVVVYWLLSGTMSWCFMALFIGGGATFVYTQVARGGADATAWDTAWSWVLPVAASVLGLLLVWTLIAPSLAYARWRFGVDRELLVARYGILFIEEKAIPISRLQHVDLYRGFLERIFGLATLIVFTAGTEGAHFRLPGLSLHRARELRDLIIASRGDDVI